MYLCSDRAANVTGVLLPVDGGYVADDWHAGAARPRAGPPGSSTWPAATTPHGRRQLPRRPVPDLARTAARGGRPRGHRARAVRHRRRTSFFHGLPYPDRPHFSAFSWAACDAAYRNPEVFASSPEAVDLEGGALGPDEQHAVDGRGHSTAVTGRWSSPRSRPTKASWWIENWIERDGPRPDRLVRSSRVGPSSTSSSAPPSRCSRSPAASACRSQQALDIREIAERSPSGSWRSSRRSSPLAGSSPRTT